MKTRQLDTVHEIRAVVGSIRAATLKGRGRILDHGNGKAKVPGHSRSSGHALIGGHTDHYKSLDSIGAQVRLEVGPDEGAVDMLAEDRFVGHWLCLDLEGMTRRVFTKWGVWLQRQMPDVNDRPVGGAPSRQQIGDPLFCVGVIPLSATRIVHALLHIDDE